MVSFTLLRTVPALSSAVRRGEGRNLLAVQRSERNKRAAAAHTALYLGAQNHIAVCSLPRCALRRGKGDGAGSCRSALLYGLSLL